MRRRPWSFSAPGPRHRPRTPGTRGPGPGARTAPRASPRRAGAWTRRRRGRHHRPPNPRGAGRAGGTAPRRPESPGSARRRSRRRGGAGSGRSATLPRPRRRLRRPGAPMRGRSPGAMSLLRAPGPAQSLGVLSAPLRPAGPCRQSGTLELQSRELRTRLRRCQPTPGFIVRHALGVPASVDLAGGCGTDPRPSHEFPRQAQGADRGESRQH